MGLSKTKKEKDRIRFEIKDKEKTIENESGHGNNSTLLKSTPKEDLICLPNYQRGSIGVGSVHHIAWRTHNNESQIYMRKKQLAQGLTLRL